MRLSFRKKMSLSVRMLAAVEEATELHKKYEALHDDIFVAQKALTDSAQKLLELHKEIMDDATDLDEAEVTDDGSLRVVTTHGTYIVGSECPKHKRVHNMNGWYVCVDGGLVNVTGWHPGEVN